MTGRRKENERQINEVCTAWLPYPSSDHETYMSHRSSEVPSKVPVLPFICPRLTHGRRTYTEAWLQPQIQRMRAILQTLRSTKNKSLESPRPPVCAQGTCQRCRLNPQPHQGVEPHSAVSHPRPDRQAASFQCPNLQRAVVCQCSGLWQGVPCCQTD